MPRNGSGTYARAVSSYVYNTIISQTDVNAEMDDLAAALTASLAKDGQTVPTANLPMGTYRHIGVGNGTARTDYPSLGQAQDGKLNWADATGTADAIAASYSPNITALVDGQICFVRAAAANATTTPTFSPNGLTARTIVKLGGAALVAGNIAGDGHELALRYDLTNTRWELLNPADTATTLAVLPKAGGTMTGDITMSGASIIEAEGAAVASASSCNIWPTDGNTVHVTGTTTINDFGTAPQAGAWMKVIFDGALTLTQSANLNLNGGGSNVVTAADDFALVYADTTTQMDVFVIRKSGASVVSTNKLVQTVEATPITTVVTCSGTIPFDDTIPQSTEGTQVITVSITPTNASNRLRIEFDAGMATGSTTEYAVSALFQDSTASALAIAVDGVAASVPSVALRLCHEMAAGTTSATTFKIRCGLGTGTLYINGDNAGSRRFGGASAARLRVSEYAP